MKTTRPQVVSLLVLVVLAAVMLWRQQQIIDWWRLRGYTPPAPVAQLAGNDTMNAYTRHLFYLNRPQLPTTVGAFRNRNVCPEDLDTIVLGCYHPDQKGIYVYAVQDPTLAGIQQVTAAHEVLHAVYARLSSPARKQLNAELEDYYQHGLTDANVKAEVALYKKTEPSAVYDEMSCTFGTEIASLPAGLDAYYAQFFTDRQKIVGYEQQYQAQFTSRRQQISGYDTQLNTLKKQIDALENSLTAQNNNLDVQKKQLQQPLNSEKKETYDAAAADYNRQVDSYNASLGNLKQQINDYNQLVDARNAIAGQLTTLAGAIDTRLQAAAE